ncbi:MAG TPA: Ig-like domain-containing protein [Candidatus Sulfotelmatobacter sp.]|nr:Ig-like domain-containing protein [Candidatus Sulfotelmatobacter sp.]
MSSMKQKLRLIGAFAALATLALAISCRGFFVNPTWQSIQIQPPSPTVAVGFQQNLTAWGTDTDGNRSQITSNLVWSLSGASNGGTVATLDPNTGILKGVAAGTVTVTASSEGVSGTATATVAQVVTNMTISPLTTAVKGDGVQYAQFTITSSGTNISSLVTLTPYQGTTVVTSGLTCAYQLGLAGDGTQDCLPSSTLVTSGSQTFTIVVTYAGYTGTTPVQATLTVNAP